MKYKKIRLADEFTEIIDNRYFGSIYITNWITNLKKRKNSNWGMKKNVSSKGKAKEVVS